MSAGAPPVATIVLNWNREAETIGCVEAAAAGRYPNQRIYVFDNGACERSRAALARLRPLATLLESPVNLGYTGGNNAAIAAALADGAEYVWLLNSDAGAGPDVLAALVGQAEADPRIGLVSPLLRQDAQALAYAAVLFDPAGFDFPTTTDPEIGRDWQRRFPGRFLLWGTALLIRRRLIERIGLLDERFFAYGEDLDYSIRSLRAGFLNHVDFGQEVWHPAKQVGSAGCPAYFYYFRTRNAVLLLGKHCPGRAKLKASLHFAYQQAGLLERLQGHRALTEAVLAGLWHGLRGVTGGYAPDSRMPAPLAALLRARPSLIRRVLAAI